VKEEHRGKGVLHRLLDAAKDIADVVVIPNPGTVVVQTALRHGYMVSQRWIEKYRENIDVMVWDGPHSSK